MDSDIDADLFGEGSDEDNQELLPPPDYIDTDDFKDFCKTEKIYLDRDYGYTQLKTFKPFYFNGQVVRGYAVFTLFNQVKAKDIYLRVRGYEQAGEQHSKVLQSFKKVMLKASTSGKGQTSLQAIQDLNVSQKSLARSNTNLATLYGPSLNASVPKMSLSGLHSKDMVASKKGRRSVNFAQPGLEKKISATSGSAGQSMQDKSTTPIFQSHQKFDVKTPPTMLEGEIEQAQREKLGLGVSPKDAKANANLQKSGLLHWNTQQDPMAADVSMHAQKDQYGSAVHNLDMRAQSQTFNTKKFWMDPGEIYELYAAKNNPEKSCLNYQVPKELVFLQGGIKAYSASKNLTEGQYVIPFSFKLPDNIPGTYHMTSTDKDGVEHPSRICYTVEMFLDTDLIDNPNLRKCFTSQHEFEVREFLFTDDECAEDVKQQQLENKVKSLFKTQTVLKPMFEGDARDKQMNEKMKSAADEIFYENLLTYFTERGQPIDNAPWASAHSFRRERTLMQKLCCQRGSRGEQITVSAQLTKPLYFTDETIELNINIDNSQSHTLDDIEVTLRQIISVKTDDKNHYKHGQKNYEKAKVYDLQKLNFGNLQKSDAKSNKYLAAFNIHEVVENLIRIRSQLKQKTIGEDDIEQAINKALIHQKSTNFDSEIKRIRTKQFKDQFLSVNMKRQFMPRPSVQYQKFCDTDSNSMFAPHMVDGLGQILSVNGFTVSSNFVVNLTLRYRGQGGCFDKRMHEYSTDFPIFIRSKPLKKERIADVEQLGLLPNTLTKNVQNLRTHFSYITESPIILPGCATAYDQLQQRRQFISRIL